jgi:hypothetical protein
VRLPGPAPRGLPDKGIDFQLVLLVLAIGSKEQPLLNLSRVLDEGLLPGRGCLPGLQEHRSPAKGTSTVSLPLIHLSSDRA